MQVTFYSGFVKRLNSTKQPAADTGTVKNVALKNDTSIETPVFTLSGDVDTILTYNYAKWGDRYYFVNDIIITQNTICELHCNIDVLATYKLPILGTDAFIERCQTDYDTTLVDTAVSTSLNPFFKRALYNIWGQTTPRSNWGYISCVAISTDQSNYTPGTAHYLFDSRGNIDGAHGGVRALTNEMITNSTLRDQLKDALGNVQSAIIKMTYIPFKDYDYFNDLPLESITLGGLSLANVKARKFPNTTGSGAQRLPSSYVKYMKFDISQLVHYPVLKDWRNNTPYTKAQLYLPFYGVVEVPLADYLDDNPVTYTEPIEGVTYHAYDMIIRASIDYVTGDIEYARLKITDNTYTSEPFTVLDTYKTSCGVNIPVSQIIGSPEKFANILSGIITGTAGGAVTGFTAGGPTGAAIGAVSGLALGIGQSALSGWMTAQERNLSVAGGGGASSSTVMWRNEPLMLQLLIYGMETNTEPSNLASTRGCPLMKVEPIGVHTGYVKTINASVDISGHDQDKGAVNRMLDSGIYIE